MTIARFKVLAVSGVGLLVLCTAGLFLHLQSRPIFETAHGAVPDLFAPQREEFLCVNSSHYAVEPVLLASGESIGCVVKPVSAKTSRNPQVLGLWGDSHAMAISNSFIKYAIADGYEVHYFGNMGCPAIAGFWRLDVPNRQKCPELNEVALNHFKRLEGAHLYLVSRWKHYFEQTPHRSASLGTLETGVFYPRFSFVPVSQSEPANDPHRLAVLEEHLTKQLRELDHLLVSLVLQPPEFGRSIPRLALLKGAGQVSIPVGEYKSTSEKTNQILSRVASASGIHVLDVENLYCNRFQCSGYNNNEALYYDDDHLSGRGSMSLVNYMLK